MSARGNSRGFFFSPKRITGRVSVKEKGEKSVRTPPHRKSRIRGRGKKNRAYATCEGEAEERRAQKNKEKKMAN